jgi:hypothetical protein
MKRLSAINALVALSVLMVGAGTAAAAPAPRAQLRAFVCHRAGDAPDRFMSVTAVMRPLSGTRRMELKFNLLVRRLGSSAAPSAIRAGGLGVWVSPPNPTLGQLPGDVWNFDKWVVDLGAPASYQFRVSYRWIGAEGQVIGTDVRYSARCREPEQAADLLVRSIAVTPISGRPNKDLYTVVIANAAAAAGSFDVLFTSGDGSTPQTRTVRRLDAHASRVETFVGPLCTAASPPTVSVDPAGQVDDLSQASSQLTAVCPASSAT